MNIVVEWFGRNILGWTSWWMGKRNDHRSIDSGDGE